MLDKSSSILHTKFEFWCVVQLHAASGAVYKVLLHVEGTSDKVFKIQINMNELF